MRNYYFKVGDIVRIDGVIAIITHIAEDKPQLYAISRYNVLHVMIDRVKTIEVITSKYDELNNVFNEIENVEDCKTREQKGKNRMTIKDLLDVIDHNREYNDEYIELVDDNGEITARFTTTSVIASVVQDWEVSSIEAREKRVIRVWLRD